MVTDTKGLRNMPCFQNFSDQELGAIAEISNSICYSSGHMLFKQGESGDLLYLLNQGELDVVDEEGEEPRHVDRIFSGEIVGGSALVPPYKYNASAKCRTEVEVLEIKTHQLQDLMNKNCKIGLKLQASIINILVNHILKLGTKSSSPINT